jgi:hypothetical protein
MPGFFGDQAMRLLREWWGSLRYDGRKESGAKDLAEELYSMFQADQPQTTDQPVIITPASTVPALTINNNVGGTSVNVNGGDFSFGGGGDFTVNGGNLTLGGTNTTIQGNTITFNAGGTTIVIGDGTDPEDTTTGGGGGTTTNPIDFDTYVNQIVQEQVQEAISALPRTVFLGRVLGGGGSSYAVEIYEDGPSAGATRVVQANVPQIAADETIPPGTWIAAVHYHRYTPSDSMIQREEFWFQPPIWLP